MLHKLVFTYDGGDGKDLLFWRGDGVGRVSKFLANIGREKAVLLIVISQHFPVVKIIPLCNNNLPSYHTQLFRVEPEGMLFEDFKTILSIEEKRQRYGFSPLDQCRILYFGWLFSGNHLSI